MTAMVSSAEDMPGNMPGLGTTDKAAAAVGIDDPAVFRAWAADRGLKAVRHVRLGRSTIALWDLDQVYAAEQLGLARRAEDKKAGHELTERDIEILDAEAQNPTWLAGEREATAWRQWRLTPTRHAQILNRLIDTEAALAHDPHTVNRLRRTRDRFRRAKHRT